jgi:uncharacterized protein involved in exopolysaccharide biosynthesis
MTESVKDPSIVRDPENHEVEEVSVLSLLASLAEGKRIILRSLLLFFVLGSIVATCTPTTYQSSMTVLSELGGQEGGVSGGLASTLRSFGLGSLSGRGNGLTAQALPNIVTSREVLLAVARDTISAQTGLPGPSVVEYLNDEPSGADNLVRHVVSNTIGLPGKILTWIKGGEDIAGEVSGLTADEHRALAWLKSRVSASESLTSGLIAVDATTTSAALSAHIVASLAKNVRQRVQEVYTSKARQDLAFVEAQFHEADTLLLSADRALYLFKDRNQGVTSSQLQSEQERLSREVVFKSQLYTEIQAQLAQSRIDLQKAQPVITIIEAPIPARFPSGPNRPLIMAMFLVLGLLIGAAIALLVGEFHNWELDPASRKDLGRLRRALPRLLGRSG